MAMNPRLLRPTRQAAAPSGPPRTLHFNAAVDTDWQTLGNWWDDAAHTIPATSLPTSVDSVVATAGILSNSGSVPAVAGFTITNLYMGIEITVIGNATFNGTAVNGGTVNGDATFNGSSANLNTVTGTATFNDNACNSAGTAGTFVPDPPPTCE